MAPRLVLSQNRCKLSRVHNNIYAKQLSRTLVTNARLRKRIAQFSIQNKEFSTTRNNLLLQKMALENEINSLKKTNVTITAMYQTVSKKLGDLEQTLQKCVPALVTMSQCVPSMIENVHEMRKVDKLNILCNTEKKERQTKTVRPMINGMTIIQPAVSIRRLNMSPIVESPTPEQTPKRQGRSSSRMSPNSQLNMVPYVRLKDVATMLKNSKAVPKESVSNRQFNDDLGEGPSWLHAQENPIPNSDNNINEEVSESNLSLSAGTSTPIQETLSHNDQVDTSTSVSDSNTSMNNNTLNGSEVPTTESSILRNITFRKRSKRRSSETSIVSDINDSISSQRTRRCASAKVNYKEPSIGSKLRRS